MKRSLLIAALAASVAVPAVAKNFAVDENGETMVDFVFVPVSGNRLVMFTLWGSEEERKEHGDAIEGIQRSIKAIN